MAQTEDTYTQSDTTTVLRSFTFPYINQSDIKVELDGVATTAYSHPNLTQIQLNSAPAVGTVIRIFRQTSDEETQATFYSGSAIRARDLNNNFTQNLYVTQEANNNVASAWKTGDPTIISTETWAGNDTKIATTGAIDGRVDAKIDTALTTDVSGGDGVTIVDNNPGTGQIRVDLDADIATLKDMQSGAATSLAALTSTELQILDGATVTTTELNTLDGITASTTELNYTDGVTSSIQTQLNSLSTNKQPLDTELTELATMSAGTASALADLTQTEVQKIDGLTASTAELNKLDGATASTTELNHVTGVTSAIQTQFTGKQALATDLTNLSSCQTGASSAIAALTQAEVQTLDGVTASTAELNILDGVTASTAELNKTDGLLATPVELNALDGITSNTSELNKLDGYTGSTTNLNIVSGKSFKNSSAGTLDTTSDTEIPSSKVIAAHVASSQTAIGGFVTIADEVSFPNTQPQAGVVVSINNAAGLVVSGSGASTSSKRVDNTTVTINGFPSSLNGETLAAGVGLVVTSTSTANTYNYHKLLLSETDIKNISDEINDFTARYRIASSAPTSNNDAGDMYFDTSANKMKVYNGTTSSWDDVASVGNFYINTISSSSGTGGGSATFNNNAYRFQLSNAPVMAQQLIVSVNGVIQKPNAGTSQPSEGFAISGNDIIFAAAPPSGSDYFIVTQGSSVSIGTPSDNTVTSAKIVDGSIVNGDISSTANIALTKLNTSGTADNTKFLRGDGAWTVVDTDVSGDTSPQLGGNLDVNTKNIILGDSSDGASDDVIKFGAGTDLSIYSNGTEGILEILDGGTLKIKDGNNTMATFSGASNQLDIGVHTTFAGQSSNGYWDYTNSQFGGKGGGLTHLNLGNANNTGTVAAARLGSGTANSGTFLAGDNTWQAISAAPEFTATASGALEIEKAVMINTDGTVVQPVNTPSAFGTKNPGTDVSYVGQGNYNPTGLAYDTAKKKILACDGSSSACRVACGSLSGTTITWGSHHTVSGANSQHIVAAYDPVNEVFCTAFVRDDYNNWGQSRALTVTSTNTVTNSANTTIRQGNLTDLRIVYAPDSSGVARMVVSGVNGNIGNVYIGTWNSSNGNYDWSSGQNTGTNHVRLRLAYDPNTKQTLVMYVDGANNDLQCKLLTTSGNASFSFGAEATIHTAANADYISAVYDTSAQKFLVLYSNSSIGTKVAVGTVSGTGISWATPVTVVSSYSVWSSCSYDAANNVTHIYYRLNASPYTLVHRTVSISGTTATVGSTATTMEQTQYGGYKSQTVTTDDGANILLYMGLNASNDYQIRYVVQSAPSTTLEVDKFVGFAKAAYSNGATATVSVNSAFLTNQSNLTAGTKYFVQGDGGLGTSAVNNKSVEAGIALSSTKLLIKG